MSQVQGKRTAWAGWVVFASLILLVLGAIQVLMAMVAFFNPDYYSVPASALAVHLNYNGWGWLQLVIGLVLVAAGYGLLAGQLWARITAIVVAGLSALANLAFVAAYPWWAVIVITLDVIVIYAVAVHGSEVHEL